MDQRHSKSAISYRGLEPTKVPNRKTIAVIIFMLLGVIILIYPRRADVRIWGHCWDFMDLGRPG